MNSDVFHKLSNYIILRRDLNRAKEKTSFRLNNCEIIIISMIVSTILNYNWKKFIIKLRTWYNFFSHKNFPK
jgi:hypothetical protein